MQLICKQVYVNLDFVSIESLCVNERCSSDEGSDDESCATAKGNLLEVEQFETL